MAADPPLGPELRVQDGNGTRFEVDARGAMGVQVGAGSVMINVFRTVAAPPLDRGPGGVESPYRGLAAFERRDEAFFFGREEAAGQVLERMSQALDGPGLLMVSGVSGAGKSSLLRAGTLPGLLRGGLVGAPGAATWPLLMFTPGPSPLDEMAALVAPLAGAEAGALREAVAADPARFALIARQAAMAGAAGPRGGPDDLAGQPRRLLLIVDQFEQLFTQCADEEQRIAFITALHAAATAGHGPDQRPAALVVLGVRADFEARCAAYPLLSPFVQRRYLVEAMDEEQLRMAITGPAKKLGARVDDDLVSRLLREVRRRQPTAGAGVLPLLSHALDQAWRGRSRGAHDHVGDFLGVADYERTGGIERAIAGSAQRTYDSLDPGQQAMARQVFTRLTATTSDGVDTAVPVSTAELTAGESPSRAHDVEAVLEAFTAERLLTRAAGTVEISHEALLTAWPLLRDTWLAETHADRIVRTRLQGAAADWAGYDRDASYLYRGILLASATETAGRIGADPARHVPLSQRERDFLQASNRARRRAGRTRQAVIAVLAVMVIGLGATVTALNAANHDTVRQRDAAISIELAEQSEALADTNATAAARDSIAAWVISHTSQARYALLNAAASPQVASITTGTGVYSLAFTADGKAVATIGGNGTALLSDATTDRPVSSPFQGGDGAIGAVAFSPNGMVLAVANSNGGSVQLWSATTDRRIGRPFASGTSTLAFSPDGTVLATAGSGSNGGPVQLWDVAAVPAQPIGRPFAGGTGWVAFSPNGMRLATIAESAQHPGPGGPVQLWDVAGVPAQPIGRPFAGGTLSVAFSHSGSRLATVTAGSEGSGPVQLWDVAGTVPRPVGRPFASGVTSAWFSPDGTVLATAASSASGSDTGRVVTSAGEGVQLWNVAIRKPIGAPVGGVDGGADTAAFSPDGSILATAGADGIVRLWSMARITGRPTRSVETGDDLAFGPGAMVLSPDGTTLATATITGDSTIVRLWNTGTRRPASKAFASGADWVVFSAGGTMLATGEANGGPVQLWEVTGAGPQPMGKPFAGDNGGAGWLAFSPDGTMVATAGSDNGYGSPAQLWHITRAGPQPFGHPFGTANGGPGSVVFSPDGTMLAVIGEQVYFAGADGGTNSGAVGPVQLWNTRTGKMVGSTFANDNGGAYSLAFSPDGTMIATLGVDGTARLWNAFTRQQIGSPITHAGYSVVFSPDGMVLATGGTDGKARLWSIATGQQIGSPINGGTTFPNVPVAFLRNGTILATEDGPTEQLWDVGYLVDPLLRLCSQVGGSFTPSEWTQYVPLGPAYQNGCP